MHNLTNREKLEKLYSTRGYLIVGLENVSLSIGDMIPEMEDYGANLDDLPLRVIGIATHADLADQTIATDRSPQLIPACINHFYRCEVVD